MSWAACPLHASVVIIVHVYARVRIGETRGVWTQRWSLLRYLTTFRPRAYTTLAENNVHNRPVVYKETVVYKMDSTEEGPSRPPSGHTSHKNVVPLFHNFGTPEVRNSGFWLPLRHNRNVKTSGIRKDDC